jgi:di/tricarboxylate transporter
MEALSLPNPHALSVLLLIVATLVVYARKDVSFETASLSVIVVLLAGFTLFPWNGPGGSLSTAELLLSFGNRGLIAICALMILGQGLIQTGSLDPLGHLLDRMWRRAPRLSLLAMMLFTYTLSSFINDTPVVVMLLPILIGVASRTGQAPTGMLMPMGFATILGGMTTTIGTSTNLLVVNVAADLGMDPLGMFDWARTALIGGFVGVAYLWFVVPRLLPDRSAGQTQPEARRYTAQIRLSANSPVVGLTLAEAIARTQNALRVVNIQRGREHFITPLPDVLLRAGDGLETIDTQDRLRRHSQLLGGTLYSGEHAVDSEHPLRGDGQHLAEVAVTPTSRLIGVPYGAVRKVALNRFQLLGFRRYAAGDRGRRRAIEDKRLAAGDVLLIQGSSEALTELKLGADLLVLDGSISLPRTRRAPVALLTMAAVIAASASRLMPIEISALIGCLVMIASGCLRWKDALHALSAKVVLIVAASLMLGTALVRTGGSEFIASVFVAMSFGASPAVLLLCLMAAIGVLTNLVSNNAAAVIGTPIAIGIAQRLGLPLEPFVLAVLFGANLCFATPMAYQTNLLIMNAANYSFGDFVRVGLPLTIILWLLLSGLLVVGYGLL